MKLNSLFLSLSVLLFHLCTSPISALKSVRSAIMPNIVSSHDLSQSLNTIRNVLSKHLPQDALHDGFRLESTQSSMMPSTLSIYADFKSRALQKKYTPLFEQALKKYTPIQYELYDTTLIPGEYGYCLASADEVRLKATAPDNFIQKLNSPRKPSRKQPTLSRNSGLSIKFDSESHRRNQQHHTFKTLCYLEQQSASFFARLCNYDIESAFCKFDYYQFPGFRDYIESDPLFEEFIVQIKHKKDNSPQFAELISNIPGFEGSRLNMIRNFWWPYKNWEFHNYIDRWYNRFYEQRPEVIELRKAEALANQLRSKNEIISDICKTIKNKKKNLINNLDTKIESLEKYIHDNDTHKDLYLASLQMIDNAHVALGENNAISYERSLQRLDSLLRSLGYDSVIENKHYEVDQDLLGPCNIDSDSLRVHTGLPIQNCLYGEYIEINHNIAALDTLSSIERVSQPINEGMSSLVDTYAQLAYNNNQEQNFEQSFALHDTCWEILDVARQSTIANMHMYSPATQNPQRQNSAFSSDIISSLKAIKKGSIQGVQQFCNQAIDDVKLFCTNPVKFAKRYTDSFVLIGKGLYKTGYFLCTSDIDEKYKTAINGYNLAKDYFVNTPIDEITQESVALLTNIGLSFFSGRANKLIQSNILKNAGKIAQAINTEEGFRKFLSPCTESIKKLTGAARYSAERMIERGIKYRHKLSGLTKQALKKSSATIKRLETKFRRENGFMQKYKKYIDQTAKKYPNLAVQHIMMGDFYERSKDVFELKGGCHTLEGLMYAIKKTGHNVKDFVFEYNDNGIIRVRTPASFMTGSARRSSGFKLLNGKTYGIKTLFSEQTNIHDIDNMRKALLNKSCCKIGKNKYQGMINGDTIKSYINNDNKATSIYPAFLIGK